MKTVEANGITLINQNSAMRDQVAPLSHRLQDNFWLYSLLGTFMALVAGFLIATQGVIGSLALVALPIALVVLVGMLLEPKLVLFIYLQLGFIVMGIGRFVDTSIPLGLVIDSLLGVGLVSLLLNAKRMHWKRLHTPLFYLISFWFFYTILETFNPEAPYRLSWMYRIRSFSSNWFCIVLIALVTDINRKDILTLLKSWLIWSFIAALWAFKQQYIGLTSGEAFWLNTFGATTHLLWGQLRSFSFYSDASQFGAEMAGVTLVCIIFIFEEKNWLYKAGFALLALVFFWGYAISGTRSALFVMLAGFPFYLVVKRDVPKLVLGLCAAIPVMCILLFTDIGNDNYQIFRIRTALRPMEDPSFLVRLQNQAKLSKHLKHLPFGAGLGTSENVGSRFSPDHFASQIPPDSWYVELWIETGIVGMTMYVAMILFIIGFGVYKVWQLKDPWLTKMMYALICYFVGIAFMGYSNLIVGQFPTTTLMSVASVLFTVCTRWDMYPRPAGKSTT